MSETQTTNMRALRFDSHGEWSDVLHLVDAPVPVPGANQIRIKVHACALNPMDWVLCLGVMPGPLPGGIGLDVSGTVEAIGEDVTNVKIGDSVFGVPDYLGFPTAGVAESSVLSVWEPVPAGLDMIKAATLPMAVETATRSLDLLGLSPGQTVLINGGGTMVGFAAVQIALSRGARVIASAGKTFEKELRGFSAEVTPYGGGLVERVRAIAGGKVDRVLQTALSPGEIPDFIKIVDGEPKHVMSITDFGDESLGIKTTGREEDMTPRYDALSSYAQLAAEGRFVIPIAQTFGLDQWREALELSHSGHAHGKLLILPAQGTTN